MFARTVSLQLKPTSVAAFTQTIAAVAISVWEQHEHAEASARGTYLHVLQAVAKVVEGTPQVSTYGVANSTHHTIVSRVAT
jgi:hypothetical protein